MIKKDIFDELIVVKRSGQRVNFNGYKIAVAIKSAFDDVYEESDLKKVNKVYESVLNYIEENYEYRKTINVEDIQDIIESKLKETKDENVYNAFSQYRKKRAASRQVFTIKQQHKFAKAMERIALDNTMKIDNNYQPIDILLKYGKTVADEFAKSYIIDNKYLRNHEEGNIYIHDIETFPLGMFSHTHLMFDKQLEKDDSISNLINIIVDSKKEISGEVNIPSIDYLFEPLVLNKFKSFYIDYLTNYLKVTGFIEYINLKKIIELINKENTLPFNDYAYGNFILSKQVELIFKQAYEDSLIKIKDFLNKKINKIFTTLEYKEIGNFSISFGSNNSFIGKLINDEVINNLNELNTLKNVTLIFKFNDNYLDKVSNLIENNKNIVVTFPKTTYNKDTFEVEYFANGIRLFDNLNDDTRRSNGRMVVGMTSINMARLGLKNNTKKEFYNDLDDLLELVKNELLVTFESLGNKNKNNYRILFNGNILTDEKLEEGQKIRKVIKNGGLYIGLVGLKECVTSLAPLEKRYQLLIEILKYINNKCEQFMTETKLNFYICEPYKSKSLKEFMTLDKSIYGIRKGITEAKQYDLVNNLVKDDYEKIKQIQKLFVGGNILELPNKKVKETLLKHKENDIGIVKFICK